MSRELVQQKYLQKIEMILNENNLKLFEINWMYEYDSNVLQILVENIDEAIKNIDFDNLVKANEMISQLLDDETEFIDPYILEVASAGAEREVKSEKILANNLNQYFFLKTKPSFEGVNEFNATLIDYDFSTNLYTFNFFIKGKPKKIKLKFEDIEFIRFAIKF